MYFHYIPLHVTPDRGFCKAVCIAKVIIIFEIYLLSCKKNFRIADEKTKISTPLIVVRNINQWC